MDFINGIGQVLDPLRLKLLVEVRRRGSISAAADACQLSQPSASKHLRKLEDALGVQLIERAGRASRLSDAGVLVADHAARVLGTLAAMQDGLLALNGGEQGNLTIAACTTTGTYVLPDLLECFSERYPKVSVKVEIAPSAIVIDRVARHEVQLGVAGLVDRATGVVMEPFLDDELIGVIAPREGTTGVRAIERDQLSGHTLLMREPSSSARRLVDHELARIGVRLDRCWELGSNEAIKRAVRSGLGIGVLSRLAVAEEIERGELEEMTLAGIGPIKRTIVLVRADDRQPTPSERAFALTLSDCCSVSLDSCVADGSRGVTGAATTEIAVASEVGVAP